MKSLRLMLSREFQWTALWRTSITSLCPASINSLVMGFEELFSSLPMASQFSPFFLPEESPSLILWPPLVSYSSLS